MRYVYLDVSTYLTPQVWDYAYYASIFSLRIVLQDDMVADSSHTSPMDSNMALGRVTIEGATTARTRFVPNGPLTFRNGSTPYLNVSLTS